MRRGVSLVEMLLAIALFGVLATIGYKTANSMLGTERATLKAYAAQIMTIGDALSGAYYVYKTEKNDYPADLDTLVNNNYVATPTAPATLSATWALEYNATAGDNGAIENNTTALVGFTVQLNLTTDDAAEKFCKAYNDFAYGYEDWNASLTNYGIGTSASNGTAREAFWLKSGESDEDAEVAGTACFDETSTTGQVTVVIAVEANTSTLY